MTTTVSTAPPTSPVEGDIWWNSTTGLSYVWIIDAGGPPGQWVTLSPTALIPPVVPTPGTGGLTFLELCQMTTRQSGTVQGVKPVTVVDQVDRLKQIVEFVREAYIDIQNAHRAWRWMNSRFVGQTVAGNRFYQATDFTDERDTVQITRFSRWGFKGSGDDMGLSIYKTADGNNEEGPLRWLDVNTFYERQARGPQTPGKPQFFSTDNIDRLILQPIPDAAYTLRGKYRKSAQVLVNDSDVPEMPKEFHTIIKDAALCYLEAFDEGPRIQVYRLRMLPNWSMLELSQLPSVTWGAALA